MTDSVKTDANGVGGTGGVDTGVELKRMGSISVAKPTTDIGGVTVPPAIVQSVRVSVLNAVNISQISAKNIPHVLTTAMEAVAGVSTLTGSQKKTLVLDVVIDIVHEAHLDPSLEQFIVELLNLTGPATIDVLVAANKQVLNFGAKVVEEVDEAMCCCFPCFKK